MCNGEWLEAIESAASGLVPADPEALLFYEEREDLRVSLSEGGFTEWTRTVLRGASARVSRFHVHAANPQPDELVVLAARARSARAPQDRAAPATNDRMLVPSIDAAAVRRLVLDAFARVTSAARGAVALAGCTVEWIGFRQSILAARPALPVRADTRESARIRIRAQVARGNSSAAAVVDGLVALDRQPSVAGLADRVVGRAVERLDARRVASGAHTIVFAPGVGGILVHELVGHALEGDVASRHPFLQRMRAPMAPPNVRVVDDPRRGRAAWRFDDEGFAATAVALIEDGRIGGVLHDARSAARAGVASSGHGRRSSYAEPVRPRMGCTYLDSGDDAPEEALRTTGSGILVHRMESAGTDPWSGRAFFRVTDSDRIEAGQLREPHLSFLITTDANALQRIDRVANDLAFDTCIGACVRDGQPLATSVGAPTCRLGLITAFV